MIASVLLLQALTVSGRYYGGQHAYGGERTGGRQAYGGNFYGVQNALNQAYNARMGAYDALSAYDDDYYYGDYDDEGYYYDGEQYDGDYYDDDALYGDDEEDDGYYEDYYGEEDAYDSYWPDFTNAFGSKNKMKTWADGMKELTGDVKMKQWVFDYVFSKAAANLIKASTPTDDKFPWLTKKNKDTAVGNIKNHMKGKFAKNSYAAKGEIEKHLNKLLIKVRGDIARQYRKLLRTAWDAAKKTVATAHGMKFAPMTDMAKPKPPAEAFRKLSAATVKAWMDAAFFAKVKANLAGIPGQKVGWNTKDIYEKEVNNDAIKTALRGKYDAYVNELQPAIETFVGTLLPDDLVKAEAGKVIDGVKASLGALDISGEAGKLEEAYKNHPWAGYDNGMAVARRQYENQLRALLRRNQNYYY